MKCLMSILAFWFLLSSCQSGLSTMSQRSPGSYDKPGVPMYMVGRDIPNKRSAPPQLYARKKIVSVKPVVEPSEDGSLFKLEDGRNHLFVSKQPYDEGSFVTVRVDSNRIEKQAGDEEKPGDQSQVDASIKEMLDALPELTPAEKQLPLIKQLKMKVVHRYANGDLLVMYQRESVREDVANLTTVRARIPYNALIAKDVISTSDLADVAWNESHGQGESVERHSSNWEDEYTLRLSGFEEARSQLVADMETKRKELKGLRDRLENRMKTFNDERNQMTQERDKLLARQVEDERKVQELETKVAEQEEELEELRPAEDKPGDEIDAAKGE